MKKEELQKRTKEFALRTMRLVEALPKSPSGKVIANQLVRCATSVGANYRSACRAKSKTDFAFKLAIVIEEADEAAFWFELIQDGKLLKQQRVEPLRMEACELVAILTASRKTTLASIASGQKGK